MARLSNDDVAEVLSKIANEFLKSDPTNPYIAPIGLKVSSIIEDFLDDRSENLAALYSSKLNIPKIKGE